MVIGNMQASTDPIRSKSSTSHYVCSLLLCRGMVLQ